MRISDWSSDVCSSDLGCHRTGIAGHPGQGAPPAAGAVIDRRATEHAATQIFEPGHQSALLVATRIWRDLGAPDSRAIVASTSTEERRVGKECVSTVRSRRAAYH